MRRLAKPIANDDCTSDMVGVTDYRSARGRDIAVREPQGRILAVLGPTNTGKTHLAVERMLGHHSGMIGLPLRLLAREIYDRVVKVKGASSVALITGEEKILPPRAHYYVCTVESMPLGTTVAFLAVDEIQLCADPERGHVFTDRLLRARGTEETMFLGADTMRAIIRHLLPDVEFVSRPRFSKLDHTGHRKLSRLPRRSAIVAFSIPEIYEAAELIRRQRGGAAVVMGALSPRTRNAQVALYESGEVDFIVATDAIGMGLNMNVDHVAFLGLSKFDGRGVRDLYPTEVAQIAGRAGRHLNDGTFGTTGTGGPIDPVVVERVTEHRFKAVETLYWRNSDLAFSNVPALLQSLQRLPPAACLRRSGENEDLYVLRTLARDPSIIDAARGPAATRLLWEVCRIPDFRKTMPDIHARLLGSIFSHLVSAEGVLPTNWFARHIDRVDRVDGDIDTLQSRLAHVRTWNYVSNRPGWLADPVHWQDRVREIEDRLSDALHANLTQRFVDRRGSILARRGGGGDGLLAAVDKDGRVLVEGEFVGELHGFHFQPDPGAEGDEQKALRNAARKVLAGEIAARADRFTQAEDREFTLVSAAGETGPAIVWRATPLARPAPLARLVRGNGVLSPDTKLAPNDLLTGHARNSVDARVARWFDGYLKRHLSPIVRLRDNAEADPDLDGGARGLAYLLVEHLGAVPRKLVSDQLKALSRGGRKALRAYGVHFGEHSVYLPVVFKAAAARLRFDLWKLYRHGLCPLPAPDPGLMSITVDTSAPLGFYPAAGLTICGRRAVRVDILDRLARALRVKSRNGPFLLDPALMSSVGCGRDAFDDILATLGYKTQESEGETRVVFSRPERRAKRHRERNDPVSASSVGKTTEKQAAKTRPKPKSKNPGPSGDPRHSPFAVLQDLKLKMRDRDRARRKRVKSA